MQLRLSLWVIGFSVLGIGTAVLPFPNPVETAAQVSFPRVQEPQRLAQVPYVPTPNEVVEEMLQLANVGKDDVVYDLGSGDGRIVITAAQKFGARGVGVELDADLVQESIDNASKAGVSDRTRFIRQDLFKADLSDATVVTLYLLPSINNQLRPKLLKELKPGTRIVSHNYTLGGNWQPERTIQVESPSRAHNLYLWTVPERTATP